MAVCGSLCYTYMVKGNTAMLYTKLEKSMRSLLIDISDNHCLPFVIRSYSFAFSSITFCSAFARYPLASIS